MRPFSFRQTARYAGVALPLVFVVSPIRHYVESHMVSHMLIQFPIFFCSGSCMAASRVAPPRLELVLKTFDSAGILGLAFTGAILSLWMIPAMLDAALIQVPVDLLKYLTWLMAGAAYASSRSRTSSVILVFFLGNVAWMMATAGLLFQTVESRLCVNYLLPDQALTGELLVVASIAIGLVGIRSLLDSCRVRPEWLADSTRIETATAPINQQ